ncbi:MAG: DNA polymerase III subunit beta [Candidatus Moranbacteria bacterium RIFCSPHIGHO2_01_FULL_55_24]|nr:MAG: DNA polymerase III subunit beta [Candidatus Moranbacteria bacterium RIFCSPHIGHO2_01_FULL_55_24]
MELICTQENLSLALSYLDRIAGKQSSLPILSNLLLETEKGRLKISATNLEIGVVVYVGAKIESDGKFTVPAKIFAHFVHNLPPGEVLNIKVVQQHLFIASGGYTMKIKGLDGKDFPIIPQYKNDYPFSLPAQDVKQALQRLLFCVSTNEARIELTGVYVSFEEGALHLAATDSFRLAEEIIPFTDQSSGYKQFLSENTSLIIPSATLQELLRVITPETMNIKLALEENQLFFEVDNVQIVSRIISGKYPDYQQIIPKKFTLQAVIEKDLFLRSLKLASSLSSYTSGEIALIFDPEQKQCTLVSQSKEIGENTSIIPLEVQTGTEPLTLVFNPRYVIEGINALHSDKLLFLANTNTSPVALREFNEEKKEEDGKYLYIMMPIRKEYA